MRLWPSSAVARGKARTLGLSCPCCEPCSGFSTFPGATFPCRALGRCPWGPAGSCCPPSASPEPETAIGPQGNTGPVPSRCHETPRCLAGFAAPGKGMSVPGQPGALQEGCGRVPGEKACVSVQGVPAPEEHPLAMERGTWAGAVGASSSSGGGAWPGGCCSRMGPGGLQGRGSQEGRQADSLGTPFDPAGPCPPRQTRAPALVRGDATSWGGRASLGDAVEHQPTRGPSNYRGRVAAWNWIICGPGAAHGSQSLVLPSGTGWASLPGLQPAAPKHPESTLVRTQAAKDALWLRWRGSRLGGSVCIRMLLPGTGVSRSPISCLGAVPTCPAAGRSLRPRGKPWVRARWMQAFLGDGMQWVCCCSKMYLHIWLSGDIFGAGASFHPPAGLRDFQPCGCWKSKCRVVKLELQSAAGAGDGKGNIVSICPGLICRKNLA